MIVVSDSSVLSGLAAIGELDLLPKLFGKITVTATICREAGHRNAPKALRADGAFAPESWVGSAIQPYRFLFAGIRFIRGQNFLRVWVALGNAAASSRSSRMLFAAVV